jgi:uncharacterized protein
LDAGPAYVIFADGTRIAAAVADTDDSRARGFMFQPAPGEHDGMLFVFARPDRYPFWMKNVRAALDIIWLDEAHRIVSIVENAPPCPREPCPMYTPRASASFVVEVAGGFVRRHGVRVGDVVAINRKASDRER